MTKALRFQFNKKAEFQPGQFFAWYFTLHEQEGFSIKHGKQNIQKRLFSISSTPSEDEVEITVKKTQNPFVSQYLVDFMKVGEEVKLEGPYGTFIIQPDKDSLFVSAGSGIAPIISMIRSLQYKKSKVETVLLYANKTESEILWRGELEIIAKNNMKHTNHFTLTQDERNSSWQGSRGRITLDMIKGAILSKNTNTLQCYICGPLDFIRSIREMLFQIGIPKEHVKVEIYD